MTSAQNPPVLRELFLAAPALTLAVAESLTVGRLQALASARSGASDFFLGGITAYTLDMKVRHLGVDRTEAARVDSVSEAVALQMAAGVCRLFSSDIGLATTGWAEPSSIKGVETPFAWWALVHVQQGGPAESRSGRIEVPGAAREAVQQRVADEVVTHLIGYLRFLRTGRSK